MKHRVQDKKVILISGGSCSGKTTLAKLIYEIIGPHQTMVISQDNYFIDYSQLTEEELSNENFDQPTAFKLQQLEDDIMLIRRNGKAELPLYDFKLHRANGKLIARESDKYIIIEGIMGLQCPYLNSISILKIFIDTEMDIMLARRILRDGKERFFNVNSTIDRYLRYVRNGYLKYVLPTKNIADVLVDGSLVFNRKEISNILIKHRII